MHGSYSYGTRQIGRVWSLSPGTSTSNVLSSAWRRQKRPVWLPRRTCWTPHTESPAFVWYSTHPVLFPKFRAQTQYPFSAGALLEGDAKWAFFLQETSCMGRRWWGSRSMRAPRPLRQKHPSEMDTLLTAIQSLGLFIHTYCHTASHDFLILKAKHTVE